MNEELQRRILEAGPHLFDNTGDTSLRAWGFALDDGWFELLMETTEKAEAIIATISPSEQRRYQVTQVKEKFGTLRVYTREFYEPIFVLCVEARERSATIRERCGKPGRLLEMRGGWAATRCEECL